MNAPVAILVLAMISLLVSCAENSYSPQPLHVSTFNLSEGDTLVFETSQPDPDEWNGWEVDSHRVVVTSSTIHGSQHTVMFGHDVGMQIDGNNMYELIGRTARRIATFPSTMGDTMSIDTVMLDPGTGPETLLATYIVVEPSTYIETPFGNTECMLVDIRYTRLDGSPSMLAELAVSPWFGPLSMKRRTDAASTVPDSLHVQNSWHVKRIIRRS